MSSAYKPAPSRAIDVDQSDIEHGIRQNQFNCAIVRAIQRRYPDAQRVRVNSQHVGFTLAEEGVRYTYPTPTEAVENVIKPFDRGEIPEPTTVRLEQGECRPQQFKTDKQLARQRERERQHPEVKAGQPSARKRQMAPAGREYQRFAPDQ